MSNRDPYSAFRFINFANVAGVAFLGGSRCIDPKLGICRNV